jgi:TolB-like protein
MRSIPSREHAMTMGLLAAFVSAVAVIPTYNHDGDEAARPARNDELMVHNVAVGAAALEAARAELAPRARIAVVPIVASKGDPGSALAALGCTAALTADLQYVPGFLVLDRSEVFRAGRKATSPDEIGRKLGVRYVVTGTLNRGATEDQLDVVATEFGPAEKGEPMPVARASSRRFSGQIYELADTVLLDLLEQLKATPSPDRLAEMKRVPTFSDSARALCDDGFALMDRSTGLFRGDDPALCQRALNDAEAALKADPRYLRASLLKASCLLRRGETERLENCLTQAFDIRLPDTRIDALTRLEVDADHAALVKRDVATAVTLYEKILEIDPGHLHALWMLMALHAGEYQATPWPGCSLEKAGDYAARLIVAHPDSPAGRLLGERKN